jgi:hypothetical protein
VIRDEFTRTDYGTLPDLILAPTARRILAKDLQVGDVITTPGWIPLTVEALRDYPYHHLTVVDYTCRSQSNDKELLYGSRTLISESTVQIAPRKIEQAH